MINEKPVICPSTNAKTSIIERLDHIGYKKIIWALAVCETIHNIEEAVWLTDTLQFAEKWNVTTGAFEIRFAIIVLTLLIYGIVYYFSVSEGTVANFLIGGVLVANVASKRKTDVCQSVFPIILIGSHATEISFGDSVSDIVVRICESSIGEHSACCIIAVECWDAIDCLAQAVAHAVVFILHQISGRIGDIKKLIQTVISILGCFSCEGFVNLQ